MTDNHLGTINGSQLLVWINARLVLCKVDGIHHLANIVV